MYLYIKSVTNISNLSPTHSVSIIRHQHRCNHHMLYLIKFQYFMKIMWKYEFLFFGMHKWQIRLCLFRFRISDQQPFDRPVAGEPLVPARFLSEFERSQANSCPRNLIFCAKSAKNASAVPKLSNKTEILHLKMKIW